MANEQQYLDIYSQNADLICSHSNEVMNRARAEAANRFRQKGFPVRRKTEEYRYTPIADAFAPDYGLNLKHLPIGLGDAEAFRCAIGGLESYLGFVVGDHFKSGVTWPEGVFVGSISQLAANHPEFLQKYYQQQASKANDALVDFNTMFAQDGLVVWVKRGVQVGKPIQIVFLGNSSIDLMTNRRSLIVVEPEASVQLLLCDHNRTQAKLLTTQVVETSVEERAHLEVYEIEETGEGNTLIENMAVELQADSQMKYGCFTLKGGMSRRTTRFTLAGPRAQIEAFGGVIGSGKSHTDHNLLIDHATTDCQSDVLFKYVLDGESVGAFAGKVLVRPDAQRTQSLETNANLCVSPKARMYTQPMLEIYADDVKCNHGSTVGKLDERALFYMAQRGVPPEEARTLLQQAFLGEAVRKISIEALRARLNHMVEERFRFNSGACKDCSLCQK